MPDDADALSTEENFHLTTGCGFAVYLWQDTLLAASFPVIKNQYQWWPFAARNSTSLLSAIVQKINSQEAFTDTAADCSWDFSIAGLARWNHGDWVRMDPLTCPQRSALLNRLLKQSSQLDSAAS